MEVKISPFNVVGWLFWIIIIVIATLNLVLIHPVPGIAYLLVSFLYFPPANVFLREKWHFSFPLILKVMLGLLLVIFTLGVSDLGDMIDKL